MSESLPVDNEFLNQVRTIVEKNIANEQFGVSELADQTNMSRSNLLRKVKKLTNLSVSQLISQVRLQRGMELLKTSSLNVSEISHQVGFSSTSYFIKCFREYYGYPPGEVGKRAAEQLNTPAPDRITLDTTPGQLLDHVPPKRKFIVPASLGLLIGLAIALFTYFSRTTPDSSGPEKSIAVLPFKNDSNDSTNVYLINGLMESTLNNLQQIKDLRVISRTTAEKYRNTSKSIPEMAKELGVNYFVEGSGQKIGERILLNIQLIEASTDKHLWSKQYRREAKDIFELQQEVAKNIAQEIQAVITPEEEKQIEKIPTENLEAYDLYLKGKELFYISTSASMAEAAIKFEKALELDPKFALAYANAVMVYYYLDIFQINKRYTEKVNSYADKAMLYDSKSGESFIAKALSFAHRKEYAQAVPYLEKALEYNPNSGLVIHFLTEFYSMFVFNRAKYLEYSLRGVELDKAFNDSTTLSFKYFHLSNAFIQAGFIDESLDAMDKSLAYNPNNPFARYVSPLFRFSKNQDVALTIDLLITEYHKDTTRIDVVKEVARFYYGTRDYKNAYLYYQKMISRMNMYKIDLFKDQYLYMGIAFAKMGFPKEGEAYITTFKDFADHDQTIYKHFHLMMYYSYKGNSQKAMEHLREFAKEDNYMYWILLIKDDPTVDSIKDLPEFKNIMQDMEKGFWERHKEIRQQLEEKGLL